MILRPLFQWRPYRGEGILATVVKLFTQQKNPGNLTVPGYLTFGHNVPCGTQYI